MSRTLIVFFSLISLNAFTQTPADWWYFGTNAAMHFTSAGPVAISNGQLSTWEGCAAISNNNGNLLFYTDGITVWNANNVMMPNGDSLMGDPSSTQSAVVVPRPQSTTQYYVFTVAAVSSFNGLRYSLVDMSLNGGLGDVVTGQKNIPLATPVGEKIAAVRKPNGYWVMTHKMPGDEIYAFSVTAAGVNSTPVISSMVIPGTGATDFVGCLKPSTQGDKLAIVFSNSSPDTVYLMDFSVSTGMVSPSIAINTPTHGYNYALEFSPNGNLLYVRGWNATLTQYDITLSTAAAITASEYSIITSGSSGGGIQLGPDMKIYTSKSGTNIMSVIHDPNQPGAACNYQDTALVLTTGTGTWGLPTFIQSFFATNIHYAHYCLDDFTSFSLDTLGVDSVHWNFGDPASGAQNTSTDLFPTHQFTDTGSFTVTLVAYQDTLIDTATRQIFIYPRQELELGADQLVCNGDTVVFDVDQPYASFLWEGGSTADTMLVTSNAFVQVTVYGVCDTLLDSVRVNFHPPITFDIGPDTVLCGDIAYELDAGLLVEADVLWNTTDTFDSIIVTTSGTYMMTATNGCGSAADTVVITFKPIPTGSLLPDDTLQCFDNTIILRRPQTAGINFLWSDSTSALSYPVDTTDTLWLAAFNECGFAVDTIHIVFNGEIGAELGEDTVICITDSIVLHAAWPGTTYQWNTGDTTDSIWTLNTDMTYVVTITKGECQKIESRHVEPTEQACPYVECALKYGNVFSPNGDGVNDVFYAWSDCAVYPYALVIYNRWGVKVYSSETTETGWDGKINGDPAPEGVYYFILKASDIGVLNVGENKNKGSVTLVR